MTGAHTIAAAIGQAHAAGSSAASFHRHHAAVASPAPSAIRAAMSGDDSYANSLNIGPLKRMC